MTTQSTTRSMAVRAHDELRASFLDGRLHPNQRLVEMELVEQLGVNRAAVREALARLEQEGLVERRANKGVIVRSLSAQEAHDVLEMRISLESFAVAWACERGTPEQRKRLSELMDGLTVRAELGDIEGYGELHAAIHDQILSMARSPALASTVNTLSAQTSQIRRQSLRTPGRLPHSLEEHRRIVEAVLTGDAERAVAEMEAHLRNVKSAAL